MAWLENIVNFVKGGIDDVKKLWVNGSQKVSKMAFDEDIFYDIANNVTAKNGGENGFVMLKEARDTMKDELDTMSLKLYNNKYNVGSQNELETAFSNMSDEAFVKRAFNQQIYAAEKGKGIFGKTYNNFDFSDMGKNLTEEQREVLMKEFKTDYDERLKDIYSTYTPRDYDTGKIIDNTPTSNQPINNNVPLIEGPTSKIHEKAADLNFNYGMQQKHIGENVSQLDFATSAESDLRGINKSINKSNHSEELNAYRSYLNEKLMTVPSKNGTWEKPDSIYDYFSKQGYKASDATELKTEYNKLISKNIASGNPDHSGLHLWQKAKRHPAIATGIVMGTAWGVSELTEDDSF